MGYKGAGITRSKFGDMYRVFVQSKGSGARHLARGSFILYEDVQKVLSQFKMIIKVTVVFMDPYLSSKSIHVTNIYVSLF